jgi:hypothetical protein
MDIHYHTILSMGVMSQSSLLKIFYYVQLSLSIPVELGVNH